MSVSGTAVTGWADQSGNNRTAVQGTSANQPSLVSSALNGKPAIRFDGTNDFLQATVPISGLQGLTLFVVSAARDTDAPTGPQNATVYWPETASWGVTYLGAFQGRVNGRIGAGQTNNNLLYTRPSNIGGGYTRTSLLHDGPTGTDVLYVNGSAVLTQTGKLSVVSKVQNTLWLGQGLSSTYFNGDIVEVLVYTRTLGAAERQQVETYLRQRYFPSVATTDDRRMTNDGGSLAAQTATAIPLMAATQPLLGTLRTGALRVAAAPDAQAGTFQRTIRYGYDELNRLTSAQESGSTTNTFSYTYDRAGNRTGVTVNGTADTFTYDAANQIEPFTYDEAGNAKDTAFTGNEFRYDPLNRLRQVNVTDQVNYDYNGDGVMTRQVWTTEDSQVINYTHDLIAPLSQVLQRDVNGTMTNYLYGVDRLATVTNGQIQWYGADGLGSVRQELSAAGAVLGTTNYDPWGQVQQGAAPVFGFAGELQDTLVDNQLVYLRARWYHTGPGMFTSVDPFAGFAEQPYSQHAYQYAYSNPIIWTDPSGWCVPGARGCPKRENVVNTGRQWCQDGIDQTPTDGIDDCAIAQDTSVFWNSFWRRALANDAQYDRLLSRSTPRAPKAPGNPLCRMRGMEYLCSAFCLGQEEQGCCGPQVDDWFAEDVRLHWDWVQNARVTAPVGGSLIGGTVGSIVGAVRGGLPGALVGGFVGGTGGAAGGWFGGFALYARGIPHKGYDFPTVGPCGTGACQGTVTLCGQCIDRSELGNMMYGIMAREWGFPYAITLAAAWQYGGMDTTADEAVIAIGYNVVRSRPTSGQRLCDQINLWPRTWTGYASDPWTTGGCTPCGADLPPGTPHTRPSFGSQLP